MENTRKIVYKTSGELSFDELLYALCLMVEAAELNPDIDELRVASA